MPAKLLNVFTDENPDLQKQIGCMTGIFQMFDRHHLLTARNLNGHNHKRLPSGHALLNSSNVGAKRNAGSPQIVLEKNLSKRLHENQRVSMESSRASFSSSSCSSSFSSLECNKSTQQELLSFDRTIFSENIRNSPKLKSSAVDTRPVRCEPCSDTPKASAQLGRHSLDFRDVVKDSIYRDTHGLSVKTTTKEEVKNNVLKHKDSPRPMQLSKSMDGSYVIGINGKQRMPADFNESLRVLAKLKEAPWHFKEVNEPPRSSYEAKDGSFFRASREAPRFSYDGREISRPSLDSRENSKSASKIRELPRLSLDSRDGSLRSSNFDSKSNSIAKELDRSYVNQRTSSASTLQQDLGSHKRPPSVVAKLMGLEAMPNLNLATHESISLAKTCTNKDCDGQKNGSFLSKSLKVADDSKNDRLSASPKRPLKDPAMTRLKNPDPVMKPISTSRVPIEAAPWRQPDKVCSPQKTTFGYREAHMPTESVYSEIEKRLKDLNFQESNKDLRALKQILDAMQAKGLLETKKGEEQNLEEQLRKNYSHQTPSGVENLRSANGRKPHLTYPDPTIIKGTNTPRAFQSPIVIMKPTKSFNRSDVSASSVVPFEGISGLRKLRTSDSADRKKASVNNRMARDLTPKLGLREPTNQIFLSPDKRTNNRTEENSSQKPQSRVMHGSSRHQPSARENSGSSVKTPSSSSPRLQQRKLESEKKSHPPNPSDSIKPRRQSTNRFPSESVSPRGKLRKKPTQAQQNDDQLSEVSSETRNLSHQDEISLRSDSNISLASQIDGEVTSADRSAEMNFAFFQQGNWSPSSKDSHNAASVLKQKKCSPNPGEDVSVMEFTTVVSEQPSPISVLDASFYRDDLSPSPVRKTSNAFKAAETRTSDDCWNPVGLNHQLPGTPSPKSSSEINHKKLEKIEDLVQKLTQLSSSNGESPTTDHIASLCETKNPDHRYVSEILLASGLLLKDLSSGPMGTMPIQLHPSGHPINPDLFLVLEQTKSSSLSKPESVCEKALRPKPDLEKLHRKLVFDAVNKILVEKLELTSSGPQPDLLLRARKLMGRFPSGQRLLKELCLEIDRLQADSFRSGTDDDENSILCKDILHQSEGWTDFGREVPGVVLEIERSIFKDLIDEVVSGEAASGLQAKPSRRRRQLFAK